MARRDLSSPFIAATACIALAKTQPDPLASEVRRRIYEYVLTHPGATVSAIAEHGQLQWAAAQFHVLRLEAAGLIATHRVGRRRLVFAAEHDATESAEGRALLEAPACRRIALALIDRPGQDVLQLAESTGLSSRVVYHHARRLIELGLVTTPEAGHYRGLRPSAALYALFGEA